MSSETLIIYFQRKKNGKTEVHKFTYFRIVCFLSQIIYFYFISNELNTFPLNETYSVFNCFITSFRSIKLTPHIKFSFKCQKHYVLFKSHRFVCKENIKKIFSFLRKSHKLFEFVGKSMKGDVISSVSVWLRSKLAQPCAQMNLSIRYSFFFLHHSRFFLFFSFFSFIGCWRGIDTQFNYLSFRVIDFGMLCGDFFLRSFKETLFLSAKSVESHSSQRILFFLRS